MGVDYMARRKITQSDIKSAYELADQARRAANYSMMRARQLKDGADKLNADYKKNRKRK
jgi:hypothetical protein